MFQISYVILLAVYRENCRVNLRVSDILRDIVGFVQKELQSKPSCFRYPT